MFDFRRLTEKMQFQRCAIFFKRAFRIPCLSKLHNVVEWEIVHRFVAKWRLWLSSKANSNTYPLSPLSADCYGPIGSAPGLLKTERVPHGITKMSHGRMRARYR